MTAVNAAPARMPRSGFEKRVISEMNASDSRSGIMDELIMSMPMNKTPRPAMIWPKWCTRGDLRNTTITTPRNANAGASAPMSSAMSWPVTVVPMLAPMMIHTACCSVIIPELMKPTTITVVALED